MVRLLEKASVVILIVQLWVNRDCGLKTHHWDQTKKALIEMVAAAQKMRAAVKNPVKLIYFLCQRMESKMSYVLVSASSQLVLF